MSQKSLLENQVIEELLRERANYYSVRNKLIDFWLLVSPDFIYSCNIIDKIKTTNFFKKNQKNIKAVDLLKNDNSEYYAAIVSTDKEFINWFKLRIGYFEDLNESKEIDYVSDGLYGIIKSNNNSNFNILESKNNLLNPSILINRYKKSLELYLNNQ
jgi:hypothetical protein